MASATHDGIAALNIALCEALNLPIQNLTSVTLRIEPCALPRVTATYDLLDSGRLQEALKSLVISRAED